MAQWRLSHAVKGDVHMPASCRYDVQPSKEQIQLVLYSSHACLSHPFGACCSAFKASGLQGFKRALAL